VLDPLQSIDATASTIDIVRCCTFEAEVKGVMFYKGYSELYPKTFQRIIFIRDCCIVVVAVVGNYHKRRKFGVTKVWRIRFLNILVDKSLANFHKVNKTSHGLIVSWRMKVWWILSICQIHQTLVTPNFRCLRYNFNKIHDYQCSWLLKLLLLIQLQIHHQITWWCNVLI